MAKHTEVIEETKKSLARATETQIYEQGKSLPKGIKIYEKVGAIKAFKRLSEVMRSELIRALEEIQRNEEYRDYGCTTFVEFLKDNPELDIGKTAYYDEKKALENEGEETFNLLSALSVPVKQRLQLKAGDIEISDEQITVAGKSAPIGDKKQVKALFQEVAKAFDATVNESEKREKGLRKTMQRAGFKFEKDVNGKEAIIPPATEIVFSKDSNDPANHSYMRVCAALAELTRDLLELPSDEATKRLNEYRPGIAQAYENLLHFADAASPTRRPDAVNAALEGLDEDDIADLLEDED